MDAGALPRVALQAAADGNLRLLKKAAKQVDLRIVMDANGKNALHIASGKGHLDICRFLIEDEEGPRLDINSRSASKGSTPVFVAASEGHLPVLRFLLACGGDPAMADVCGGTPLHGAALNGQCDAVRLLLSKGAPVDPLTFDCTPLHFALAKDHHQVLGILLDHGANPNKMMNQSFSPPLVVACGSRCLECIKLLVQAGADVNLTSPYGQTALNEMVSACLPDIVELKEAGADPNYPDMVALDDNLANIVKFLLEAGADANIPNEHGKIPLMLAAAWGPRKLVETLFPWTKPIPSVPDWNVDAIIGTMKLKAKDAVSVELEERLCSWKSKGKEAFGKGDYLAAMYFYGLAIRIDPLDATLFSNRSVSFLRMGKGESALADAQQCRMMRPQWAKAWYREGAALRLLKSYNEAVHAFKEALKLDPASEEIKNALREAMQAMGR